MTGPVAVAARLAAVAAGVPVGILSEPVPARREVAPDPALAAALAPRRARMAGLTGF